MKEKLNTRRKAKIPTVFIIEDSLAFLTTNPNEIIVCLRRRALKNLVKHFNLSSDKIYQSDLIKF